MIGLMRDRADDQAASNAMGNDWAQSNQEFDRELARIEGEEMLQGASDEPMDDLRGLGGRSPNPGGEDDWANEGRDEFQQGAQNRADDQAISDRLSQDYADNDIDWTDEEVDFQRQSAEDEVYGRGRLPGQEE